ncbi:PAAR domain-containing protein [Budviciaceae bacterium BWR-B9]|uniref:PAAR domain-containing protein n=1 Tax=Limnobaculum allomyrinae TaxID=2791986 RepID=A0ABS1IKE6_9GAMM|nr:MULTISPECIES: PAAR domain-containing protein [Limnobaculum]MBK5142203.1 PAAR domain-containing protein [Limnobaculum allomyrinae]MBV7690913.1 PAAR domain-containing protein [Limnobaculum sp. M2-1]
MKGVIRLGDATDHGGKVISASSTMIIHGKGVARVGDLVNCPQSGHGINKIIGGEETFKDQGIPVALDGHKTECGCTLISSISTVGKS